MKKYNASHDDKKYAKLLKDFMYEMRNTHAATECLPAGKPSVSGGGSGHTKKRKTPNKKKTVSQLYKEL